MSRDSGGHFQQRLHLTWHQRPYWKATRTTCPRRPFCILEVSYNHGGHFQTQNHVIPRRPSWITRDLGGHAGSRVTSAAMLDLAWPRRPCWISRDLGGHLGSRVTSAAILDLAWPRRPFWISRDLGGHLKSRVISATILILTRLRQSRTNNCI